MKTAASRTILIAMTVACFGVVSAQAQYQRTEKKTTSQESKMKGMSMDMTKMMREPHHMLAVAYKDNLSTFTTALRDQVSDSGSVNVEFARAAVAEMRRSFDQMEQHLQEHMKAMSGSMGSQMSGMTQQMETHLAPVREHLAALEKEIQAATPDPKKVSEHTAEILKHLDAISKMHGKGMAEKMKMEILRGIWNVEHSEGDRDQG